MTAQQINGLGSSAILACNAVKTSPIKEPAKAQIGSRKRVETSLAP